MELGFFRSKIFQTKILFLLICFLVIFVAPKIFGVEIIKRPTLKNFDSIIENLLTNKFVSESTIEILKILEKCRNQLGEGVVRCCLL